MGTELNVAFNQNGGGFDWDLGGWLHPLSTMWFTADRVGVVDFDWNVNPQSDAQLNFFGLTGAPGASVTIVPEPSTALLLGLGLVGMAARRRV